MAEVVPHGPAKDLLSGTWLGHPLHPMLTDLPIGFWTSAMAVDFLAGQKGHKAADRLVALGVLSALPTAAAGLADWSDTMGEERRLGWPTPSATSSPSTSTCGRGSPASGAGERPA